MQNKDEQNMISTSIMNIICTSYGCHLPITSDELHLYFRLHLVETFEKIKKIEM